MNQSFTSAAKVGQRVLAVGTVLKYGKSLGFTEVELRCADDASHARVSALARWQGLRGCGRASWRRSAPRHTSKASRPDCERELDCSSRVYAMARSKSSSCHHRRARRRPFSSSSVGEVTSGAHIRRKEPALESVLLPQRIRLAPKVRTPKDSQNGERGHRRPVSHGERVSSAAPCRLADSRQKQ